MAHFKSGRPCLGTVAEMRSRAGICAFCDIVSERLEQRNDVDALHGMSCYVQAIQFCTDSTLREHAEPLRPDDPRGRTRPRYPFEPTLHGLENYWDRTTARMVVVIDKSAKRSSSIGHSYTGTTIVEFQACPTPVPTVIESIQKPPAIPQYGGRLLNANGVDPELVRFWIDRCETEHGPRCASASLAPKLPRLNGLLLIDTAKNCIVEGSSSSRFVALSYVWGATNTAVLTKSNHSRLAVEGALKDATLPATIRDTISVTRWLGARFLWIDALCIRQDDQEHKASQIEQMASVYASALVTIMAVSGTHADAGLSRVSTLWKQPAKVVNVVNAPGVSMIPVLDSFDDFSPGQICYSKWYSRAWTMQEHILSTRKLIFSENQVYWHCPQSRWVEETELEFGSPTGYSGYRFGWINHGNDAFGTGLPSTGIMASHLTLHRTYRKYDFDISALIQGQEGADGTVSRTSLYEDLAIRFMNRCLTLESDRLNAFTGILKVLSALTGEHFIWGLPEGNFCHSLTWVMPNQPRTHATQLLSSKSGRTWSCPFPSWSWIAWESSRRHDLHFGSGAELTTGFNVRQVFSEVVIYQVDTAGRLGRIEDKSLAETAQPEAAQPRLSEGWKLSPRTLEAKQHGFDPLQDCGILKFWSSTATLQLCRGDTSGWNGGHFITPDSTRFKMETDARLRQCLSMGVLHLAPGIDIDPVVECEWHTQSTIEADVVVIGSGFTGYGDQLKEWMLHVIVVEWKDHVAYRIGAGTISEYVWVQLENRIWELVTLG
ncbi:hypothetical protein ACHAPT_001390 [Fusarium lateritium]